MGGPQAWIEWSREGELERLCPEIRFPAGELDDLCALAWPLCSLGLTCLQWVTRHWPPKQAESSSS